MDQSLGQSQLHDATLKIITIGTQSVGKSSLLRQYFDSVFQDKYKATIGVDLKLKTKLMENGKVVKVQIFDTAGQEKFRSIVGSYYKGANGVAMVYDITKYQTFSDIQIWYKDLKNYCPENITIILIGNKLDLEEQREVTQSEGEKLAKENNMIFFETSAKENLFVTEAFDKIVDIIYAKDLESRVQSQNRIGTPQNNNNLQRSGPIKIENPSNNNNKNQSKSNQKNCC